MKYVAIDLETADAANSAPCAIALTFIEDAQITSTESVLLDPEVSFNPFSSRIHGITAEDVEGKETFLDYWDHLSSVLNSFVPIAHNASFDFNVLRKATKRYGVSFPEIKCLDTMKAATKYLPLVSAKLETVCQEVGIEYSNHHNPAEDSLACAELALYFLSHDLPIPSIKFPASLTERDAFNQLDEFEKSCLQCVKEILNKNQISSPLIRFKKDKDLSIDCYYRVIKIGIIRNRRFIGIRTKYQYTVNTDLEHDSIKPFDRYFLNSPEDLNNFSDYICTIAQKSIADFATYQDLVSEGTVKKHMSDYYKTTYSFM